jgi:hypothetical protein
MHKIRDRLFNDIGDKDNYLDPDRTLELVDKFGCVPRTVFDFGNRSVDLDDIERTLEIAYDVERLFSMVGSSVDEDAVVLASLVHIVPDHRLGFSDDGDQEDESDEFAFADKGLATVGTDRIKRLSTRAEVPEVGRSSDEKIKLLKARYTWVSYAWISDDIRDKAFRTFTELSADRMMTIIRRAQTTSFAGFQKLLLEPFVHKLFTETGVLGRFRDLETGKELATKSFGPWKTKHLYRNSSEVNDGMDVYNMPHKGNETSVHAVVPWRGLCFKVATSGKHGIHRPGFVAIFDTHIFDDFKERNPKVPVQFIWVVDKGVYEKSKKQDFYDNQKRVYKKDSPLRSYFNDVQQKVFKVDIRRIYDFRDAQRRERRVDMTSKSKVQEFENAVKELTLPKQTVRCRG